MNTPEPDMDTTQPGQPAQPTQPNQANNARRQRLKELQAIAERQRSDAEWDELNELEISMASANRENAPGQPARRDAPAGSHQPRSGGGGGGGGGSKQGKKSFKQARNRPSGPRKP